MSRRELSELVVCCGDLVHSIAYDDLEDFVFQAECNAGMNLATATMDQFIVARQKVEECDRCALGYQLVALSALF